MGDLAGFTYRDVSRRLRQLGFVLHKQSAGSHELWKNLTTRTTCVVANHRSDIKEGTLRSILRQAGIAEDDFLA